LLCVALGVGKKLLFSLVGYEQVSLAVVQSYVLWQASGDFTVINLRYNWTFAKR